jgi:hypothetical protein
MKGGFDKTNIMLLIIILLLLIIIIMIFVKFHSKHSEGFIGTNKTANGEKCSSDDNCISDHCVDTPERGMVCISKPPPPLKYSS